MNAPDPSELIEHWLALALGDLQGADVLLQDRSPAAARQAAELAHQAAEKALKSVLVFLREAPPKTHDLKSLLGRIPTDWRVHAAGAGLSRLADVFGQTRYPSYFEPPLGRDEALALLEDARAIVERVVDDLVFRGISRPGPR